MKVNLHTHTARCHHAYGTDEAFAEAGLEAGFHKLGFSDHVPFPYPDGFENTDKMDISELEGYMASIRNLKSAYTGRMEVYLGAECEPIPEFFPFLGELRKKMDYLILGNHGDKRLEPFFGRITAAEGLKRYVQEAAQGLETGLFLYLAHPDLMLNRYPSFDENAKSASRELCILSNSLGIPMEYNLHGNLRVRQEDQLGYPCAPFWELAAEENCTCIVGVDAHLPGQLLEAQVTEAQAYLRKLGLTVVEDPTALPTFGPKA